MIWLYAGVAVAGLALTLWAEYSLPASAPRFPVPIYRRTERGPYRWLAHPMYVGNVLLVAGLGGLAAGFWNALALGTLAELVMREWAWRERQ